MIAIYITADCKHTISVHGSYGTSVLIHIIHLVLLDIASEGASHERSVAFDRDTVAAAAAATT